MPFETISRSESETEALGAVLAKDLRPGDVVALTGDLGAGKTAFVSGLARGLSLDPGQVSSPTFALVHEYRGGRLPLFHVDLYRLSGAEAEDLGLDELGVADGVLAIEWPERLGRQFAGAITVRLESVAGEGDDVRRVLVEAG